MRAGEVAQRAGVNVETLRYYERRGLLPEPPRTPNGHRRYDEDAVRFLRAIKEAQAVGFTLAEIEEYLRAAGGSSSRAPEALRVRMAAKIDEIDARIAALRRMRDGLARVVGCGCDSLDRCTCGAAYLARRGADPSPRPSVLHVTNGESAGDTLRRTSLGGAVLPWQDVLHEGPIPVGSRKDLLRTRAAFLSECGWGSRRGILSTLEERDRRFVESLRGGVQVVLWFEHDLYDQLQLLDALALAGEAGAEPELIVVDSFPGRKWFRGLGELTADELETLWPRARRRRRTSSPPRRRPGKPFALRSRWRSRARRTPDSQTYPSSPPALLRLLEELPAPADGLSGTERRALQALAAGARTPAEAFVAAQQLEDAPFLGDAWFFRVLTRLGGEGNRLVETQAGEPLPEAPPLGDAQAFPPVPVRLTSHGTAVLAGEVDGVELLGIDRWVGGTHLAPGQAWRWDPVATELVEPA